ncbi:reverse transcriptase domain-containing protein [Tanacetum coccineum]
MRCPEHLADSKLIRPYLSTVRQVSSQRPATLSSGTPSVSINTSKDEKDEDLKKRYKEVLKSPFTRRIIKFLASSYRMPANLKIYDGSTIPNDHITHFMGAANQGEWEMRVWWRMFQQTLDGPARGWFDRMPNGCIDRWTDLRERFAERFALRSNCSKDLTKVSKLIRQANETLPDFKEC